MIQVGFIRGVLDPAHKKDRQHPHNEIPLRQPPLRVQIVHAVPKRILARLPFSAPAAARYTHDGRPRAVHKAIEPQGV
ncbi:unnamed protein product [Phytomonas sp. EM1]|nr:unnamed protein product [Phytomonas sp. EM1]|eukprot:CCW65223.1 unnamed protein product [Phytomonas sp. isolate EM1]